MPKQAARQNPILGAKTFELILGVIGIIIGLFSSYLTILTFPSALDAVGKGFSGAALPADFAGLAGKLTLFLVVLTMVLGVAILFAGLVCLFEVIFYLFGFQRPRYAAVAWMVFFFWISTLVTIGLHNGGAAVLFAVVSFVVLIPLAPMLDSWMLNCKAQP